MRDVSRAQRLPHRRRRRRPRRVGLRAERAARPRRADRSGARLVAVRRIAFTRRAMDTPHPAEAPLERGAALGHRHRRGRPRGRGLRARLPLRARTCSPRDWYALFKLGARDRRRRSGSAAGLTLTILAAAGRALVRSRARWRRSPDRLRSSASESSHPLGLLVCPGGDRDGDQLALGLGNVLDHHRPRRLRDHVPDRPARPRAAGEAQSDS